MEERRKGERRQADRRKTKGEIIDIFTRKTIIPPPISSIKAIGDHNIIVIGNLTIQKKLRPGLKREKDL